MSCIIRDVEGKPWGVLGAHAKRRVTFTVDNINFLMSAANILADAIHRHRTESVLQQNERQLRDLAETIPQLAWYANPDGFITWYNKRWYDYTGTSAEQMRGWGWQSVHDPAVLPEVLKQWKSSIATGQPFSMVFPLRGADGVFRPFLTKVMPLTDDQGCVVQWFGTNTDISEQQEMQEALRASQQRFSEFMQCLPGLAWIKDLEGRYVYANEAAQNLFGKASDYKIKKMGLNAIYTIVINTILPFFFCYGESKGDETYKEKAIAFLESIKPESNSIIKKWENLGIKASNAFESQALLQLKNNYWKFKRCLECQIGNSIITNCC